ncbi:GTPase-activating protein GYP3 [Wickerhamiella sorbophila]|uniref:GTPase-activating protein GYP3 n=1 Tax=Wickerhamiella sorbophila TaxID=45607 RepID=A0A2T0FCK5_9ASCO|nr:GTPase-activating protein GYP3 [Wickerhamiella sorbophila]PRT52726.1 GTPase-activating protein GYP3 [Wickerhamiella sorbophila]
MEQAIQMPAAFIAVKKRQTAERQIPDFEPVATDVAKPAPIGSPAIEGIGAVQVQELAQAFQDNAVVGIKQSNFISATVPIQSPVDTSKTTRQGWENASIGSTELSDKTFDFESQPSSAPPSEARTSPPPANADSIARSRDNKDTSDYQTTVAVPSPQAAMSLVAASSRTASVQSSTWQPSLKVASVSSLTPSMPPVPDAYDQYGFRKRSAQVSEAEYNKWYPEYSRYQKQREAKWLELIKDYGLSLGPDGVPLRFPPRSEKLRRYIRKGIPPSWRGAAWFWYAKGPEKLNAHPGLYARLCEETKDLKNNDTEHIERDLHRTFPDNRFFRSAIPGIDSEKIMALRRVLTCFAIYQPKIGYCQSLNFIGANLLLFMDEERAFWMMVLITSNYLQGLHEVDLEQVNITQGILMVAVRDRLPKVWNALSGDQQVQDNFISQLPPISLCTASWFMSMFVCVLPIETTLRVWDVFFFEGPKILYRISLAIMKLAEPQILRLSDDMEAFQAVQTFPRKLLDPTSLFYLCFKRSNGVGHLSDSEIAVLHQFVANRRREAKTGTPKSSDRDEYARFRPRQRLRSHLRLY